MSFIEEIEDYIVLDNLEKLIYEQIIDLVRIRSSLNYEEQSVEHDIKFFKTVFDDLTNEFYYYYYDDDMYDKNKNNIYNSIICKYCKKVSDVIMKIDHAFTELYQIED